MKNIISKISLALLPIFCFSSEALTTPKKTVKCAENYTGFDINVGVGGSALRVKVTHFGVSTPSTTSYGDLGYAIQARIGTTYGFCKHWLIGLASYGQYNSPELDNRFTVPGVFFASQKFKIDWSLGFDVRLGVVSCPTSLIFIYGGPDWGHYSFRYATSTMNINDKFTNFKIGGRFGAGLEHLLTKSWLIRSTFDYTWYPSKTYNHISGESHKVKPNLANFLFLVGYLF